MFKSRKFLVGLGVGLIISSLFLIFFTPSTPTETQKNKEWTVDELREAASIKGYKLLTNEEIENLKKQIIEVTPPSKENNQNSKTQVDFIIVKGNSTSEIADYLLDREIIINKDEFLEILEDYHLTKKIRAGEYKYSTDMTVKETVALITHTNSEEWKK